MNFSSLQNNLLLLIVFMYLVGCQNLQTRERSGQSPKATPTKSADIFDKTPPSEPEVKDEGVAEITAPVIATPELPKLGIILGPGGAKAFAHVGFLKELHRSKVPVVAAAGIEWGSLMAALYTHRASANDVEWQALKFSEHEVFKKKIFNVSSDTPEFSLLQSQLKSMLGETQLKDHRMTYACPAFRYKQMQNYVMAKGSALQAVSYCIASPPIAKSFGGYTAGLFEVQRVADFLRSRGANYIIYVNVLAGGAQKGLSDDTSEVILWQQVAEYSNRKNLGVDYIVDLNLAKYGILDFKAKRDIVREGAEQATSPLKILLRKWNL